MAPTRGELSIQQQRGFRQESVAFLRQAAMSDDPFLRMQALEAFQDVATDEGLPYVVDNLDNGHPGVSFAALMTIGVLRQSRYIERVRMLAEDSDPNVRIAALFALHRFGDKSRTGELSDFLLADRDARVRGNAALAIGRLEEPSAAKPLERALRREKKEAVKLQVLEGLAMLGNRHAIERLIFSAYSAAPDQASLALMFLANARCAEAEEVFRTRLRQADHPEIKLQAARGLGYLGVDAGEELAAAHLWFNSPQRGRKHDPPEQQIARVRALAALALGAIGNPGSLGPLKLAFDVEDQAPYVRLAIARAALSILDKTRSLRVPPGGPPAERARLNRDASNRPRPANVQNNDQTIVPVERR